MEDILTLSKKEAKKLGDEYVYSYHIILAILSFDNDISLFLNDLGIVYNNYRSLIKRKKYRGYIKYSKEVKFINKSNLIDMYNDIIYKDTYAYKYFKILGFCKDELYYDDFKYGKILKSDNKLIGRDKEINKIIEVLTRKNKNNPLLIGKAGVGKTAIIEDLSNRLNKNQVPFILRGKKIYSIDISSLVAGTKYRGEFEEKLNDMLNKIDENVIIFIDEIHTLMGAGASDGGIDASQIIKPFLDRNKIRCIGSTTTEEYRKYILKDKALSRRFEVINVREPSIDETLNILLNIKEDYEKFYNIKIDKKIINNIVYLSKKYITFKNDPDRSIDLLDNTCSYIRIKNDRSQEYNSYGKIVLKNKNKKIMHKMNELEMDFYKKDLSIKKKDILDVLDNYYEINTRVYNKKMFSDCFSDIYLKGSLLDKIYKIYKRIINGENLSILLNGPSGVGKSLIVNRLSHLITKNVIKLNMSDYIEEHSISKIIGSPPGYTGYEDDSIIDKLRPGSILILDEIDKCARNVLNLFLGIIDDQKVRKSNGEEVDLNISIFMTSNIGESSIGFNNEVYDLSVPFLSRLDDVISFKNYDKKDLKLIIKKISKKNLSDRKIDQIIDKSNYKKFNARGIMKELKKYNLIKA